MSSGDYRAALAFAQRFRVLTARQTQPIADRMLVSYSRWRTGRNPCCYMWIPLSQDSDIEEVDVVAQLALGSQIACFARTDLPWRTVWQSRSILESISSNVGLAYRVAQTLLLDSTGLTGRGLL
jgi:hypothetical protein